MCNDRFEVSRNQMDMQQMCGMFVNVLPHNQFQVWTDHAPLVSILIHQALPYIANQHLQDLKMKVETLIFETVWLVE